NFYFFSFSMFNTVIKIFKNDFLNNKNTIFNMKVG
ncbi:unnamed protein product, partial [marine sediment metagenome]